MVSASVLNFGDQSSFACYRNISYYGFLYSKECRQAFFNICKYGRNHLLLDYLSKSVGLDVDGLVVVLKPDLITGEQFFLCKDAVFCEQRDVFSSTK